MADVFISYSKAAPQHTRDLARDLEARGFTVWWDTELLPGDQFHERICSEITAARIVIVIWSPASIVSKWVQAEATMASAQNKLLTVCTPDLDASRVPLPFNMLHIEKVGSLDKIISAFAARGLVPRDQAKAQMARRAEECVRLAKNHRDGNGRQVDAVQAIELLREAIQLGHPAAKRELAGIFSSNENGIKPRYAEALRLYHEAKAGGDLMAATGLAFMYLKGEGVTKDLDEAIRLLQEAADANLSGSHLTLGILYRDGMYGVSQNLLLAKKHFLQGAAYGDVFCLFFLGRMCVKEGDLRAGANYFQRAIELGLTSAKIDLAETMLSGLGTATEVAESLAVLEKECLSDDKVVRANALAKLGLAYLKGISIEKNVPKAVNLLSRAADLDSVEAINALGNLYNEGSVIPRDDAKAVALLARGVALGSLDSKAVLGQIQVLRGNFAQGLKLLHEAERQGHPYAPFVISMCHYKGWGVGRDLAEARRWIKIAGNRGIDITEALRHMNES